MKNKLRVQKLIGEIPVVITPKVLEQIKYLTTEISSVEWSGVLFYSTKGNITNIEDFVVTLEYIYLMHKGNPGSTEYDLDEELVGFRMDNPESFGWQIGHIHSHNSMATFFSGTDMEELNDNSEFHNYYVSIIVNNRLDVTGKVAFVGESKAQSQYVCRSNDGKEYKLQLPNVDKVLFVYDCDIDIPTFDVSQEFIARTAQIIKKAEVKKPNTKALATIPKNNSSNKELMNRFLWQEQNDNMVEQFIDDDDWMVDFPSFWLCFGELGSETFTIHEALRIIERDVENEGIAVYSARLIDHSTELYEKFFTGMDVSITDAYNTVYEEIGERGADFPFVKDLLAALAFFIEELEKIKV